MNCSKKKSQSHPLMSDSQEEFLEVQQSKSLDINQNLEQSTLYLLEQNDKIKILKSLPETSNSLEFDLPESIETPYIVETENFFYIYNVILSTNLTNIAQYNKEGKLLNTFGRKGQGPLEFTSINALSEKDYMTYILDNGYLKKINENLEEVERKFLKLWANDIKINDSSYDLRLSNNKVFPFPISNVDYRTDSINFSIEDKRPGALNFTSSNETTFDSNENLIVYAKTTLDMVHIIPKKNPSKATHLQIKSNIVRKNTSKLDKKRVNTEQFYKFMNSLFLINKLHLFDNILWISFLDRDESGTKHFLGKVNLNNLKTADGLNLEIIDTSQLFTNVHFYNDYLFIPTTKIGSRKYKITRIKLDEL